MITNNYNNNVQVSQQFSLTVETPSVELPIISSFNNVSVNQGDNAVLSCSVRYGIFLSVSLSIHH